MDTETDLREMVLAFAATLGRRCAEAVETSCLTDGRLEDKTEAGGVEWHFVVFYDGEDKTVKITGHPHAENVGPPALLNLERGDGMLGLVFGQRPNEDAFDFNCPVAWLPDPEA